MSQATAVFQHQLTDLLGSLTLDDFSFTPDQDSLSLLVDERFAVHFSLINDEMWTIEAELSAPAPCDVRQAQDGLSLNAPCGRLSQPVVALNRDGRLYCWIGVPLVGSGPALRLDALDAVLATLAALHAGAPSCAAGANSAGAIPA